MAQKRSTTTKSKAKTRKTQKKRTKKGKVYIAPYKLIILCAAVIALCMGLLVVSTAVNQRAFDKEQKQRIEQQREEEDGAGPAKALAHLGDHCDECHERRLLTGYQGCS